MGQWYDRLSTRSRNCVASALSDRLRLEWNDAVVTEVLSDFTKEQVRSRIANGSIRLSLIPNMGKRSENEVLQCLGLQKGYKAPKTPSELQIERAISVLSRVGYTVKKNNK